MKKTICGIFVFLFLAFIFHGAANAQTQSANENQKPDQPLKIKKKYPPKMGDCSQANGRTRLKVTFDKSAKVTNAEVLDSSNCTDFDRKAIEAAMRIIFEPAIKNGEAVTVTKIVEYDFRYSII